MRKFYFGVLLLTLLSMPLFSDSIEEARQLLTAINSVRQQHETDALKWDQTLSAAASGYALESIEQGFLAHRDREGGYAVHRVRRKGGTALKVGEVLGAGRNIESIISGWMNSPSHRSILLNDEWTHTGGAVEKTDTGIVIIMLFRMRPFSRIEVSHNEDRIIIRLIQDDPVEDTVEHAAVVFSRGRLYEASGSGRISQVSLGNDEVFYHLLAGIQRNNRVFLTDRILLSEVLTH